MILCKEELAKAIDKAVFPGTQGGPLMHIIAGKAIALKEAMSEEFKAYQHQVRLNAKAMENTFKKHGINMVSGGTDNHLILLNLIGTGMTGKELNDLTEQVNITLNKNAVPWDPEKPTITSGVRIGTPAITTRGFKEADCEKVAELITDIIRNKEEAFDRVRAGVKELIEKYPLYEGVID
jgi:glycine hydroxymethyltransferase